MEFFVYITNLKIILSVLAILAGIFVITTKNAILSVFNLIVLYILIAFYLIYLGITFLGISYIVVYIGAIAILFLFIIMMIDIEILEKRSSNYLPLLLFLFITFFVILKIVFDNLGIFRFKGIYTKEQIIFMKTHPFSSLNFLKYRIDKDILFNKYIQDKIDYNKQGKIDIMIKIIKRKFDLISKEWEIYFIKDLGKTTINFDRKYENDYTNYVNSLYPILVKNKEILDYEESNYVSLVEKNYNLFDDHYLIVYPDWLSALNKITQISAIGDVFFTIYHSYIYIISIILLLAMVGAIILTAENKNKMTNNILFLPIFNSFDYSYTSEGIIGSLFYFLIFCLIIAILLILINYLFSISIKYLEKRGGFECGFTSFFQTRERFNIIFYRVSLLFLIFDLEIILIYPFPALSQKIQSISKNNVLIFLYILVIGFIYELKEGALNIIKKYINN